MARTTVGEIQYIVSVDTKGLVTGLKQAESTVKDSTMNKEAIFDGFQNASKKAFDFVKNTAKVAMVAVGAVIATHLDSAVKRLDTMNNFPNVMKNFGISAEDAKASIDKIAESLKGLPTSLDTGAAAVQRFTSKNGDVAKSTDLFLALNNAVLAGGAPMDLQTNAMEQMSQAYAKGKPDMKEWLAMMSVMPAQLGQVATAMGLVDADALGESLRDGSISMDEFMDTVVRLNTEGVDGFDNLNKQARNATGGVQTAMANLDNAINRSIASVIESIGTENLTSAIEGIGKAFETVGKVVGAVINFFKENQWAWEVLKAVIVAITIVVLALAAAYAVQAAAQLLVMLTNPFTLIMIGVMALIAVVILLVTHFQAIVDFLAGIAQWVWENVIKPVVDFIVAMAKAIWDAIKWPFELWWQIVSSVVIVIFAILATIAGWLWDNVIKPISDFFVGLWDGVVNGVKSFVNAVMGVIIPIANWINDKVIQPIARFFAGLWDGIKSGVSALADGIKHVFGVIVGVIKGPINGIISAINGVIGGINSIKIPDWVPGIGGASPNFPTIPMLATGGIVEATMGGQIVRAGEAGEDEWVVPESKMASMIEQLGGGGGGTYNIYLESPFSGTPQERRRIAREIVDEIQIINRSRMGAGAI